MLYQHHFSKHATILIAFLHYFGLVHYSPGTQAQNQSVVKVRAHLPIHRVTRMAPPLQSRCAIGENKDTHCWAFIYTHLPKQTPTKRLFATQPFKVQRGLCSGTKKNGTTMQHYVNAKSRSEEYVFLRNWRHVRSAAQIQNLTQLPGG